MKTNYLSNVRKLVPWYLKIVIKIFKAYLPLNYNIFSKLGLFRHGKMDLPEHAIDLFHKHFSLDSDIPRTPFVFLEIGPGDSLFSGIIASFKGARKSYLIDAGDWINKDVTKYLDLIRMLFGEDYLKKNSFETLEDIKKHFNIVYLTNGLTSLRSLPESEVDLSFSNACFEHIPASEVVEFFRELKRVSKTSTLSSHCIDFKDHLDYSLNNLRFSKKIWEADIIKRSGIYTNRLRFVDMQKAADIAGFKTTIIKLEKWESLPLPRKKMHKDFSVYQDQDLMIKESWIRLN
jgi:hypothetical protein